MSIERQKVIAAVLIHHATIGSGCSCGHRFRIGDSMSAHRAEQIDKALDILATEVISADQLAAIVNAATDLRIEEPVTVDPRLPRLVSFFERREIVPPRPPHVGIAATYADNAITVP